MKRIVNKVELINYLHSLLYTCEYPVATEVAYIYLRYERSYTPYLRLTIKGCTANAIRSVVSGLLHLEQTQPDVGQGAAYASVLRGTFKVLDMLGATVLDMRPVAHCEMLECSGVVVTSTTNETLADGQFAPTVEVYSAGVCVFNDHISWLFVPASKGEKE